MPFRPLAGSRLFLATLAILPLSRVLTPAALADDYKWAAEGDGLFATANWYDYTTAQNNVGPPGAGDGATVQNGAVVTVTGGAVDRFFTENFGALNLAGNFSVNTLGDIMLTGSGNLTAGTLGPVTVGENSGYSGTIGVMGGNLIVGSAPVNPFFDVEGGSVVVQSDVSSGSTIVAGAGSSLQCVGTLTGFNATISDGATLIAQAIGPLGGQTGELECDDPGTVLSVSGSALFEGVPFNVHSGAQATIGGGLQILPATTGPGAGGSLDVDGAGSTLTVGATLQVGPASTGANAFTIANGGAIQANVVDVDFGGSMINGGSLSVVDGLSVGNTAPATLDVTGTVAVTGSPSAVAIGFAAKSKGNVSFTGAGTLFNTGPAEVALGKQAGSLGSITLSGGAVMLVGTSSAASGPFPPYLHVGDAGSGSLEVGGGGTLNVLGANVPVEIGSAAQPGPATDQTPQGSVVVSAGGTMSVAGSVLVGNLGSGTLDIAGGATVAGDLYLGFGAGATGKTTPFGLIDVTAGGSLEAGSGRQSNIGIGNEVGSEGTMFVSGQGAFVDLNGTVVVGNSGDAKLGLDKGARGKAILLAVGAGAGSLGSLNVSGTSTMAVADFLVVGGIPGKPGGHGFVTVQGAGLLTVARILNILSTGSVDVAPPGLPSGRVFVGSDNEGQMGAVRVGHGGVLKGKGKRVGNKVLAKNVIGDVFIGAGGKFLPGGDPDVFSITGDCDLSDGGQAGGETDIEVAGTGTAGTDYDQIVTTGKVTLGGTLKLVLMEGYKPQAGDTIEPVKAKTTTGSFKEVVTPGLTLSAEFNAGKLSVKVMSVANVPAPMITSDKSATAHVGEDFSYQIVATGLPAGYAATGLPAGLDIDPSTGLITGTPTTAGSSSVTLSSTSVGGTGKETLQLDVAGPVSSSPAITVSDASIEAPPDAAFSYQIVASNSPTSYAATDLPPGLSLDAVTGLISGQPTKDGNYQVTLSATNVTGTGTAKLKLVIALPAVKVVATVPLISVGGDKDGEFTLSIPAALNTPLMIHYKISGSAEPGKDYIALKDTAVIKAGQMAKVIKVVPKGDLDGAMAKVVKLTLVKEAGYTLHAPEHAKVKIVASH